MSMLMQLLIGREIAKRSGVEDNAGQMRIGAIAAAVPSPVLGLVVAKVASDRAAPARVVKPGPGEVPVGQQPLPPKEGPDGPKPPASAGQSA